MEALLSTIVSGLVLGSLYALMASGLSLVWTTLGVFNFAHGALMMIGAMVAWTVSVGMGLGLLPGMIAGVLAAAVLGAAIEYLLVRPFYGSRAMLLVTVMTTLAAMIILEKGAQVIWGARLKQLPRILEGEIVILGTTISAHEAIIIVVAPLVLILLWIWAQRTATGRSLRAAGQNRESAALIGIDVPRAYLTAFAMSAALAGFTGVLLGAIRFVTPTMGAEPLLNAMIVVIFGGLGSLGGTVGAAYAIGFLEAFLILTVGLYWSPAVMFLIIIAVLVLRPEGLFGKTA
ncbi:MAG: branched-chain amino acid ABC transporter permease [Pseudomonadota bacterium]